MNLRPAIILQKKNYTLHITAVFLFLFTFFIYVVSNNNVVDSGIYFSLLSYSFLHGQLSVQNIPFFHFKELINFHGHYYIAYPPLPAIILIPFVFLFGIVYSQLKVSLFLGAVNVACCYVVLRKFNFSHAVSVWISLLFGFGTNYWYTAVGGSAWYFAHIVGVFFLWMVLWESASKKRPLCIGIYLGLLYLSRIPTAGAFLFPLLYNYSSWIKKPKLEWRKVGILFLGMVPFFSIDFIYNYLRYGTIVNIGYLFLQNKIPRNLPGTEYGLVDIRYLPINIIQMLTLLPRISRHPPYLIPSVYGLAIWFTTPAFLLLFLASTRSKLFLAACTSAILCAIPSLMHGQNGYLQFGYRYMLDYLPFLLLLIALGFERYQTLWAKTLILVSMLINCWGIVTIRFLHISFFLK